MPKLQSATCGRQLFLEQRHIRAARGNAPRRIETLRAGRTRGRPRSPCQGGRGSGLLRLDQSAFAKAPSISIDCAVMERTAEAVMLPIDVGWSDVGSWASLWNVAQRDANENYVNGTAACMIAAGDTFTRRTHLSRPSGEGSGHRQHAGRAARRRPGVDPGRCQSGRRAAEIEPEGGAAACSQLPAWAISKR